MSGATGNSVEHPRVAVFLLGPLTSGLSGGDVHALRLVDYWHRLAPGTVSLLTPESMAAHLPRRAKPALRVVRTPLDGRLLPMPVYVLNVTARALLALLRAPRADIVVAASHFFHDAIPCAARSRVDGARVVAYAHHLVEEERRASDLRSHASIALERFSLRLLRSARALVFVDNASTAHALEARGFAPQSLVVTQNAYDPLEPLPPRAPTHTPVVAFVGRLAIEKGVWDAVEVARRLPDARVVLLGDGPLRAAVSARRTELRLENLELRGFVPETEKWELLRRARLFIAPSREEGWGIAVGEALTAGLPVVAYDLPAYAHFGDRLVRVPIGDVELFVTAVREALARPHAVREATDLPRWDDVLERERTVIASRFENGRDGRFERAYWEQRSVYRKFRSYESALSATRSWYAGLLRLVANDLPPPGRALDVGCGHGAIVHLLAEQGWDVTGLDTSSWIIEQARAYAPKLRFVVGDAAALPEDREFDLITCFEVLEHLDDPVAALSGFRARLAREGRLIATTPNLSPVMPWPDPVAADSTHVSVHDPRWWRDAVERAGLRVRSISTFVTVPLIWRLLGPAGSWWIPLGPRFGPNVLISAERSGPRTR